MDVKKSPWYKTVLIFFIMVICFYVVVLLFFNRSGNIPVLDTAEPFVLPDVNQQAYDSDNGKVKLLAFFYTNCPDICPLTMMDFKKLQRELKEKDLFGSRVELLAITLDPELDSFKVLKEYGKLFDADIEGWKFLRGSPQQTKEIADSYHMIYKKEKGNFFSHSTTMFLIDGENRIRGLYDMANSKKAVDTEEIMAVITELAKE